MTLTTRRQFLAGAATFVNVGFASEDSVASCAEPARKSSPRFLKEHGFWDYTTPGAGGMERYRRDDYLRLLDDMAQANMNSLLIMVKWYTTGYRSRLPWLDQDAANAAIASDNGLVRLALEEAAKRQIKVWLGAVVSMFSTAIYGGKPNSTFPLRSPDGSERVVGVYDPDMPQITERAVSVYEELVTLFPQADGFLVEIENCDTAGPHREAPYNEWAVKNGRPEYKTLQVPLDPRNFNCAPWRDYATYSRARVLRMVESALRGKGFRGDLAMICETGSFPYAALHVTNLEYFRELAPGWAALTYDYSKWLNRYAMADFCLVEPKKAGLKTYYLPRGVMTWGGPLPISLEESWRMDVEDVQQFEPDGVWWFGSGSVGEGSHVSHSLLQKMGFRDGVEARRRLLKIAGSLGRT